MMRSSMVRSINDHDIFFYALKNWFVDFEKKTAAHRKYLDPGWL